MREGYKESELVEIPEGWEVLNVGEVCKLKGGFAFKSSDACDDGIRWVKIANVGVDGIKWDDESFLPFGFGHQYRDFVLREGDIIVAMTRPILNGKLKIARISKLDSGSLLNQRVGRIEESEELSKDFAYQFFNSTSFITAMEKELMGTDPPNISSSMFEALKIALPSYSEQQKIAEILSTVDDKLDVIDQQINETQALKKGLMQRLLTKGIGHTEFKDSSLGEIPKNWFISTIGEECEVHNNKREPISAEIRKGMKGEYPYYGPTKAVDFINRYTLEGDFVLIGEDGDHFLKYKTWSMTQYVHGKFNVNNHAHILKGTSNCITKWIHYFFQHRDLVKFLTRQGASRYKLTKASLLVMRIKS